MDELNLALKDLKDAFRADGYDLSWAVRGDTLTVRLVALPGACAECLVPKEALRGLLGGLLAQTAGGRRIREIELIYPAEDGGDADAGRSAVR
jgi:hypothetical protein